MERIGIYGGTFNPPHLGHVRAVQYALKTLALDKMLVIPTHISPHKQMPENSPTPQQRLAMLEMCFGGEEKVTVSSMELDRGGTSYTFETVAQIRQEYPDSVLILFMGTDMFLSFLTWKNPERILENASLAVFYRGQRGERDEIAQQKSTLEDMGATIYLVDNPVTVISSTDLRRMLIFSCAQSLLPEGQGQYIRENGLYGTNRNCENLSLVELEKMVVSLLKPSRVNHVLGCRDTAVQMAKCWGADETDAARAALLHDVTKALDGPLQIVLCESYGIALNDFARENPKTIHALTGSLVAGRIFGENQAVVDAIRSHTTAKADMNLLEKIIYVADYMEPNRDFPGVEDLRELAFTDLDAALKCGLTMTVNMLREQGREISKESLEALRWLENI